jgi:hypothetical protein
MAVLAKRIDWPTEIRLEGAETGARRCFMIH